MLLTAAGCAARRQKLQEQVDASLIVITNPRHIFYLCGLYSSPLSLSNWGQNFLILDPYRNTSTLIVHNFLAEAAQTAYVDEVVVWTWYDAATQPGVPLFARAVDELNLRLAVGGRRIGVEKGWLPWHAGMVEAVDVTEALLTLRRQKMPDELALIRAAVRVAEAGQRAARAAIQPDITELDMYNAIHAAMVQEAGHPVLMIGDFISGERILGISGAPTPRRLAAGELMICDLSPIVNGYRADFTATLAVSRSLTDEQAALQAALHAALAAGEAILKAGVKACEVYQAVRSALAAQGAHFAEGFTHHAGHGLGLGHPEAPFLVPGSEEVLLAGDVVTLEPGTYNPASGIGGRIEHNYLITETGYERLSSHSTQFV